MKTIESAHRKLIFKRRVIVLKGHLLNVLPDHGRVLDVGCGDGLLDYLIMQERPALNIEGIDVLIRPYTHIPVTFFDGTSIPFDDNSFDAVQFVDVLHHTLDPESLLREATRVARTAIIIKDHLLEGAFAGPVLRLMDWVGNAHHGVNLPYEYWPRETWQAVFNAIGAIPAAWTEHLGLYPPPAGWLFDRNLHFITRLQLP